ncbi:unnamed protein product [Cutaneotrichosporon oleaginosum]
MHVPISALFGDLIAVPKCVGGTAAQRRTTYQGMWNVTQPVTGPSSPDGSSLDLLTHSCDADLASTLLRGLSRRPHLLAHCLLLAQRTKASIATSTQLSTVLARTLSLRDRSSAASLSTSKPHGKLSAQPTLERSTPIQTLAQPPGLGAHANHVWAGCTLEGIVSTSCSTFLSRLLHPL